MILALFSARLALEPAAAIRAVLVAAIAGVFLALLGPFGTDAAPLLQRLAYWLLLTEIGTGFGVLASVALQQLLDPNEKREFLVAVLTAVIITLPAAAVVFEITKFFFRQRPAREA